MNTVLPRLPDELWMQVIYYSGFDDVWTMKSSMNVDHVLGYIVDPDDPLYYEMGDPWFFTVPDDMFEAIFGRQPKNCPPLWDL